MRHLLTECPAYGAARINLWGGPLPTLDGDETRTVEFLRRVGRTDPPVDAVTTDHPAGGGGGPRDVKHKKKTVLAGVGAGVGKM